MDGRESAVMLSVSQQFTLAKILLLQSARSSLTKAMGGGAEQAEGSFINLSPASSKTKIIMRRNSVHALEGLLCRATPCEKQKRKASDELLTNDELIIIDRPPQLQIISTSASAICAADTWTRC